MKSLDYSVPWGRPREGTIDRQRDIKEYSIHLRRITDIPHEVDSSKPISKDFVHTRNRLKKQQLVQHEQQIIANGNRKLMAAIANIKADPGTYAQKGKKGQHTRALHSSNGGGSKASATLHEPFRRRQVEKINRENQEMLKRIQNAKPTYSKKSFEKEHKVRKGYIKNISRTLDRQQRAAALMENSLLRQEEDQLAYTDVDVGVGSVIQEGSSLKIRTAKQIRADLARQNDWEVPDTTLRSLKPPKKGNMLYSRSVNQIIEVPMSNSGSSTLTRGRHGNGSVSFEMSHVGNPSKGRKSQQRAIFTPDSSVRFAGGFDMSYGEGHSLLLPEIS